jgi:hypothetical protein
VNSTPRAAGPRCFLHVPKSAGTSVHVSLETALPPGAVSPKRQDAPLFCGGFNDFDLLDPGVRAMLVIDSDELRELSDSAVVSGHFSLSTLLRITDASSITTVLREPRSRVLSHYAFWRLSPTVRRDWRGDPALDHALRPLDEFLSEPQVAGAIDNLVCRMLLRGDTRIPDLGFIAPEHVDDLGSRAITALQTLGFVGVLELGDSMWTGLSRFFGVSLAPMRLNTTAADGQTADAPDARLNITEHTLELLDARTAVDAIVYRHALASEGYSADRAERLSASAFADELVRLGDVAGASASELRERVRCKDAELHDRGELLRIAREELAGKEAELAGKEAELAGKEAELAGKEAELAGKEAELALHRGWLDAIQGSASWRVTTPARAAKRALMRLRT